MRLPIKEYLPNHLSHILNIDTIINIICTYNDTLDWLQTFEICIPKRKLTIGGKSQRKENDLKNIQIDDITP